jgi:hypothetical protein
VGLIVDWAVDDPGVVGGRIATKLRLPLPDRDADSLEIALHGGWLRLRRPGADEAQRLAVARADDALATERAGQAPGVRLLGVGWATVDAERVAPSVAAEIGIDPGSFGPADDDAWLGARATVALVDDSSIVVLEPSTEGRLAAALARFGEGPVAIFLGLPGPAAGATRPGPLGPASLVLGDRPWGPFILAIPIRTGG